jgi:hypothetical protein
LWVLPVGVCGWLFALIGMRVARTVDQVRVLLALYVMGAPRFISIHFGEGNHQPISVPLETIHLFSRAYIDFSSPRLLETTASYGEITGVGMMARARGY